MSAHIRNRLSNRKWTGTDWQRTPDVSIHFRSSLPTHRSRIHIHPLYLPKCKGVVGSPPRARSRNRSFRRSVAMAPRPEPESPRSRQMKEEELIEGGARAATATRQHFHSRCADDGHPPTAGSGLPGTVFGGAARDLASILKPWQQTPRVSTLRGCRRTLEPYSRSWRHITNLTVEANAPCVHAGRDFRQDHPSRAGGRQKAHPMCTHGTRFLTKACRNAAFSQLVRHSDLSAARKCVPCVHAGRAL